MQQGPGPRPFDVSGSFLVELDPPAWLEWLGLPVDGPVSSIESDVGTVLAEVDKVIYVDAPRPWLAHIELQANHDPELPFRLLEYHALLLRRHKIRVETTVILLRPSADDADLNGRFEQPGVIHDVTASLRYRVLRLWETPAEELLSGAIGLVPLAPLGNADPTEVPGIVRRMHERYDDEVTTSVARELRAVSRFMLGLRYDENQILEWIAQDMSWLRESSLYQIAVQEGREEGLEEGRIEEARRLLLAAGTAKLGPADPGTSEAIGRLDDVNVIERLVTRLFSATSWQDLLTNLPGR